ncbi:SRPBCC family protein [Fulvimonas yonginensis]|uniref:SRPBCC family protein n=1 Tax=Fulvimonas yonginensis TaxID=1495200 RepID=A0ABU8JEC5_9GAMM
MPRYEASTTIEAPADGVWRLLCSVDAWPQWLPTVSRAQALDGGPLAVGRRYRIEQPRLRPAIWTVTALESGRRFEWRARSPGMTMVADHRVAPEGHQAVRVQLSFAFRGLLGSVLGMVYGDLARRYLQQEAQALKQRVEAG